MLSSFSKSFRNSFRKIRKNDDERRDDKRTQSMNINRSYSTDAHIYSASFMTCKESQNNSINLERYVTSYCLVNRSRGVVGYKPDIKVIYILIEILIILIAASLSL
jgi:hypothetical protein